MNPFEATLLALLALPTYHEDLDDPRLPKLREAVASEVSELKPPPGVSAKDWRALVLAVGAAETHFALRIAYEGRCRPHECDHGRARSPWQMHLNDYTRPVWDLLDDGYDTLHVQAQTADKMLKVAYYTCARSGQPFPQATILAFAGRGCSPQTIEPWKGLALRIKYYQLARRAMEGKK